MSEKERNSEQRGDSDGKDQEKLPASSAGKRILLVTYGCQMNEYDTELVRAILAKAGYAFVPTEDDADIVLLNTCAIRENAHRKVYGRVHEILHKHKSPVTRSPPVRHRRMQGRACHQKNQKPLIGILGCMATNLRTELFEDRGLKIDFIAGPDSYKRLPNLIEEAMKMEGRKEKGDVKKIFDVTLSEFETYSDVFPKQGSVGNGFKPFPTNAWIAVMRGCNNFCTFCVVPYTRGRERSRSVENVVEEVRQLAAKGFKQVTVLGQNVNSYRHGDADFADLLDAVSRVDGIERIRFTSPHPKDFPERLLRLIAENPKVCKHIHLPLQAGNNRILNLMNRTYTQEEFLKLADKIRTLIPHVSLTTDIIAGFPTETEEEFQDTIKVMRDVEFDSAFIFKYSERKNTIAAKKYPDDVPDKIKSKRTVRLNDLQKAISFKKNQAHIDQTHLILLEETSTSKSKDDFQGRSDGNKLVIFPRVLNHKPGDFLNIQITSASAHALRGKLAV